MPFTFSHPALILPFTHLQKKYLSTTGLVIGSLTPDFEYFLRMETKGDFSHSIAGIFLFNFPLGLLLTFVFHNIIRFDLFNNFPAFIYTRLSTFNHFNWNNYFKKNWFIVSYSLLLGTISHIFWDSFTHETGFFVQKISSFQKHIIFFNLNIPFFKLLQHFSTLLGGLIIILYILKLPKKNIPTNKINLKYWFIFTFITLLVITLRILSGLEIHQYVNLIVTTISATIISLILTPLIINQRKSN
jgi:hypothetical protein